LQYTSLRLQFMMILSESSTLILTVALTCEQ
jgi:hypothetical protein